MDLNALVATAVQIRKGDTVAFEVPLLPVEGRYRLRDLRDLCREYGEVGFTVLFAKVAEPRGLKVEIDTTIKAEEPYLALNMIARDDAPGLRRAILSAVDAVDEIVVGVDSRSDEATLKVAEAYADRVVQFEAVDVGLSAQEWAADEMHFANARNHSRAAVTAPWTLVLDADEILGAGIDLIRFLRAIDVTEGDKIGGIEIPVKTPSDGGSGPSHVAADAQRLARTKFRYRSATHNQLRIDGEYGRFADHNSVAILHEGSLRPPQYAAMRAKQRNAGIEKLVIEGKAGNMSALFHAAKHLLGADADPADPRGVELVEEFRMRIMPHDPSHMAERVYLAIYTAIHMHNGSDLARAEMWATRAILDGPNVDAFVLLGMIAEEQKDLYRALSWYEAACACTPGESQFLIEHLSGQRFALRDSVRRMLILRPNERRVQTPET